MVNGNYVLYGDRPSSESEIVDDHVPRPERKPERRRKAPRYPPENRHNGSQLDNETDSVKYEKKIKEPRLLRYVPTTDVEEHFVNENFETYDLKPTEERPRKYAFIKKPRNPSDGSVNYAYSRSSSSSPSVNLPTISEHVEQYGTYRVRPHRDSPKMVDVQAGYECKLDKYFTKPRDLKFPPKGSHPDSLYRVPAESGAGGGKLTRLARALRWPLALVVICVALAVFVYFLMPDHMTTELELVNSTFWDNSNSPHATEEKLRRYNERMAKPERSSSTDAPVTTQATRKPGSKTPEIDFHDVDSEKNYELSSIIEAITNRKPIRKIPVAPVFPSKISPEVQYGNENADVNKLRAPKVLDKLNPGLNSTVKPHITQKPEKPLSVYFKRTTTTPRPSTRRSTTPSTTTTESANDYMNYGKEVERLKQLTSNQNQKELENYSDLIQLQDYIDFPERPTAGFNFTSGHSKYFGIGIEDASKIQSTTQSSVYHTRVSPTLPTWRHLDDTTTKKYPENDFTSVPQCHSPRQPMCRGVLPYDLAGASPTLDGVLITELVPQMDFLISTNCSTRARQFLCALLEPECNPPPYPPKMPCYGLCKAVVDYCDGSIPQELVNAFKCKQYPTINCIGARSPCHSRELQCGDGTCVPRDWMCDGTRDCPDGEDEEPCISCEKGQYKCPTSGACVKREWLCDGYNDCPDGEDEEDSLCKRRTVESAVETAPAQAAADHEPEETAGSAPAPSVRRPNRLPDTRHRNDINGDDSSKELLITSDSSNALKRNYTRRPSSSRLTPYRPKLRHPPPTEGDSEEATNKPFRRYKVTTEAKVTTEDDNTDSLSLFDENKENPEQNKHGREASKSSFATESTKAIDADQHTHAVLQPGAINKFERVIDGAALLRKAVEETKQAAANAEPYNLTYDDYSSPSVQGRSHSSPCPSGELRCVDGLCITLAQLCDGTVDCTDHADEDNCYT